MLRPYQQTAVDLIRSAFRTGTKRVMLRAATGSGKCLGRGTGVLLYDGTIRAAEDVRTGDVLVGPDSGPRRVLSTASGRGPLYRVTPVKGDSWICNDAHILSLVHTETGKVSFVTAKDYAEKWNKNQRRLHKQWRSGVTSFSESGERRWSPYLLGLFIGDGTSSGASITVANHKPVIREFVLSWAEENGLVVTDDEQSGCSLLSFSHPVGNRGWFKNPFRNMTRALTVTGEKRIPHAYLTAPREDRLKLLAGIIDTDGHCTHGGCDLITVSQNLANDYAFLARSLGFAAYINPCTKGIKKIGFVGNYYRLYISGDLSVVPLRVSPQEPRRQIKNVLRTGITVEHIGEGEYFGFEIDGDRQFLLGDFTVTHNTVIFCYIANAALGRGSRVMVIVKGRKLVDQASQRLRRENVPHGVFMANHPGWAPERYVQVCSIDTLTARGASPKADLIIIDEAHQAVSKSYRQFLAQYPGVPLISVTATPYGSEPLDHLAQTVVEPILESELIEQGFLVPPKYYAPPSNVDFGAVSTRGGEFVEKDLERQVTKSRIIGSVVQEYKKLALGKSAIVFCVTVAHAEALAREFISEGVPARVLHAKTPDDERDDAIASREVLLNVGILGTGVDIPWIECVIMARPTMSVNLYLQQLGRGTRPYEGKAHFLLLDHAENIRRHGLMTDVRPVDLAGTPIDKNKSMSSIRTCERCYLVYESKIGPTCPSCGHTKEGSARNGPEVVAGELVEVSTGGGNRIVMTNEARDEATRLIEIQLNRIIGLTSFQTGKPYSPWVAFYKTKEATKGRVDEAWLRLVFRRLAKQRGYLL